MFDRLKYFWEEFFPTFFSAILIFFSLLFWFWIISAIFFRYDLAGEIQAMPSVIFWAISIGLTIVILIISTIISIVKSCTLHNIFSAKALPIISDSSSSISLSPDNSYSSASDVFNSSCSNSAFNRAYSEYDQTASDSEVDKSNIPWGPDHPDYDPRHGAWHR